MKALTTQHVGAFFIKIKNNNGKDKENDIEVLEFP